MIGIFGGTFDPVHYGHLRSALEAKEIFGLEEIRLIPSAHPPHRTSPRASATMRLEMLYLAVENMSGFVVDTREIDRAGQSYMVITLESLRRDFPDRLFVTVVHWHGCVQRLEYVVSMAAAVRLGTCHRLDPSGLSNRRYGCFLYGQAGRECSGASST